MKAVVYERYGPPEVLELKEVPRPVPKDNEVLIRIHATTVSAGDWRMRRPSPFAARLYNGLFRPKRVKVLGFELAGTVEAVGKDVKKYRSGDQVFSFTGFKFGSYAEYICLPEGPRKGKEEKDGILELKPSNMTFEEAAGLAVGGLTALNFLRKAGIKKGQDVLIYGASGTVGTFAVQIAKYHGAKVTGVCSTTNMEMVRSIGADRVIDYTREDLTEGTDRYDIIFDAVAKAPRSRIKKVLKRKCVFISSHDSSKIHPDDLKTLRELVESGKIRSVIDRTYQMEEIVEAHRYVEKGHKKGNVVIRIINDEGPDLSGVSS
jgi:NADPH:quinone reductase-like Zn-dependent oxidoreductase